MWLSCHIYLVNCLIVVFKHFLHIFEVQKINNNQPNQLDSISLTTVKFTSTNTEIISKITNKLEENDNTFGMNTEYHRLQSSMCFHKFHVYYVFALKNEEVAASNRLKSIEDNGKYSRKKRFIDFNIYFKTNRYEGFKLEKKKTKIKD